MSVDCYLQAVTLLIQGMLETYRDEKASAQVLYYNYLRLVSRLH